MIKGSGGYSAHSAPDAETNMGIQIGFITVLAFTAVIALMVGFGGMAGGVVGGVLFGILGGALNQNNRSAGVVIGVCIGVGVGVGLSMNGMIGAILALFGLFVTYWQGRTQSRR